MIKYRRKFNYVFEIFYNKWSPFIISLLLIIYHTLHFLFPWDLTWVQYLCLPSLFTSLHMYNSRQTFMLCKVHRCFVNYVVGNILASIAEHYWINPYLNLYWFVFVMFGTMLALLLGIFYYTKEHEKVNSRIAKNCC